MNPQTVPAILGPVGGQGFANTISPQAQSWIVLALFGVGFLGLMFFGFIGGQLDVQARGGAGRGS